MLRIYDDIIALIRELAHVLARIARHDSDLAKQFRRAAASIALNTAEAGGVRGGSRRLRFSTALGSAKEVRACLEVAVALGYIEPLSEATDDRMDKVIATLFKLAR